MYILAKKNKDRVIDMFQHDYHIPALAVMNNNYPGRIYVDDIDNPRCSLIWVSDGWGYFRHRGNDLEVRTFLQEFFSRELPELMRQLGDKFVEIYGLDEFTEDYSQFKLVEMHKEILAELPEGYEVEVMEVPDNVEVKSRIVEALHKNGVGQFKTYREMYEVWHQKKIVSKSEDVGIRYKNYYLVNVHTFQKIDRHHGYAKYALTEMIREKMKEGMLPIWETRADNIASVELAKRLGFEKKEEYEVALFQWK